MIDFSEIVSRDEQLRDYQHENKIKIYRLWQEYKSVLLQMPTGTGKTRLFVSIVKDLHNWGIRKKRAVKTLILAHRKELIEQIAENIGYRYGLAHGIIMANFFQQEKLPTQIASVQTIIRRLEKWKVKKFDIIIIDEAHHALATSYINIINAFPEAKILGVTATPCRLNGAGFTNIFDELIISPSVSEFIKSGYLSNYSYFSIRPESTTQKLINGINKFALDGDYDETILSRIFDTSRIRANIVDTYLKYANGKKGIVYTIDIKHNKRVCNDFNKIGVVAKAIDSKTKKEDRKQLVNSFKNGEIDILCNVNIFSEGFDCPDVEFIQLARPTKSLSMYLQQVGRGFRINENKEKVVILDNVGLYNRFGLPSAKRKWRYHFEGHSVEYETDDSAFFEQSIEVQYIKEIEEGDENVELIFDSNAEPGKSHEFDVIGDFPIFQHVKTDDIFFPLIRSDVIFDEDEIIENGWDELDEEQLNEYGFRLINNYKKVLKNSKWGIYDTDKGCLVLDIEYDEIKQADKLQRISVRKHDSWGIIDASSWMIKLPVIYEEIEPVNWTSYFSVKLNGKLGVVDINNNTKISLVYHDILPNESGNKLHFNVLDGSSWIIYDENFEITNDFEISKKIKLKGYSIVKYNDYYGIIDKNQNLVVPCFFNDIVFTGNHLSPFLVQIGHFIWGVLDKETDFSIFPQYNSISVFNDDILKVKKESSAGLIKHDGTVIISLEHGYIDFCTENGYYLAHHGQKQLWMALNHEGIPIGIENRKKKEVIKQLNDKKLETIIKPPKRKRPRINQKPELQKSFDIYSYYFSNLKGENQKQKAVLLISILELIASNKVNSNRISIDDDLITVFSDNYIKYLGGSFSITNELGAAFFRMHEESFWKLISKAKQKSAAKRNQTNNPFNLNYLRDRYAYGEIHTDLFKLLQDDLNRNTLKIKILSQYLK